MHDDVSKRLQLLRSDVRRTICLCDINFANLSDNEVCDDDDITSSAEDDTASGAAAMTTNALISYFVFILCCS